MSYTDEDISKFVDRNNGGEVEEVHGPSSICGIRAWEVWVYLKDDEEYAVRYAIQADTGELQYVDGFQALCDMVTGSRESSVKDLQKQISDLQSEIGRLVATRRSGMFLLIVAAIAFMACVAALLYLLLKGNGNNSSILAIIGGVVASGGALFFGRWIQLKK